jgi:hypothetical protein
MRCKLFTILILASSCIDEIKIDLPPHEPKLIVDALISSEANESQLTIGWTSPIGYSCTDSFGNVIKCGPEIQSGPYKVDGEITISDDNEAILYTAAFRMNDKVGLISLAPNFGGVPGARYLLTIKIDYEGQTSYYSAETTMLETPAITEITYIIRKGDIGKNDNFVPLISFIEPEGVDYYLFQLCQVNEFSSESYCGNI